jgi:SAM-dependent methyltransferase
MTVVFDNYSKYYDLVYQDKDYNAESDYLSSLIEKYNSNTETILELGCGTGKHAKLLNDRGYEVYGIDLSETMLEQAKELGINCELADVCTFKTDKNFDTILSLFHVASYQTTDEAILSYFNTASTHLNPGGVFIFDLWYKPAVLAQLPEKRIKELENSEIKVKRFCEPNHIKEDSVVEVSYNIEITDKKTGAIDQIAENHAMRYFSEDEIKYFAAKNNIVIIHSEEWLTAASPSENTWGVCFVGVKK